METQSESPPTVVTRDKILKEIYIHIRSLKFEEKKLKEYKRNSKQHKKELFLETKKIPETKTVDWNLKNQKVEDSFICYMDICNSLRITKNNIKNIKVNLKGLSRSLNMLSIVEK